MTSPYETSPALTAIPAIRHGFFGRRSGHSTGSFAANNMSITVGDQPDLVEANRAGALLSLGYAPRHLHLLKQVHSNRVHVLTTRPDNDAPLQADAMVTNLPGLALGILTADCTPILLADPDAGIVAAAHAGWRGAVDGIIGNTVDAMVALGANPAAIVAAIGPTISGPNYEVGAKFMADFLVLQPGSRLHFTTPPGKREHFDLPRFIFAQLRAAGIASIDRVGDCTYAHPDRYFSHRYATHHNTTTGRQIAVIGLS